MAYYHVWILEEEDDAPRQDLMIEASSEEEAFDLSEPLRRRDEYPIWATEIPAAAIDEKMLKRLTETKVLRLNESQVDLLWERKDDLEAAAPRPALHEGLPSLPEPGQGTSLGMGSF